MEPNRRLPTDQRRLSYDSAGGLVLTFDLRKVVACRDLARDTAWPTRSYPDVGSVVGRVNRLGDPAPSQALVTFPGGNETGLTVVGRAVTRTRRRRP